jgi:recombinational DNA repair protein (RecF pathway)
MKLNIANKSLFGFYEKHLSMIIGQTYYEKILMLIILEQFIKLSGVNIEVNHCVKCNNHKIKTISFKNHGMICNLCFDSKQDKYYELTISKTIHFLFNESYEKLNSYLQELDFVIKLLRIYIDDNSGIKLNTIKNY